MLQSAPREYLLRSQRETNLLKTLLMKFWFLRDALINEHKVDSNFVFNGLLNEESILQIQKVLYPLPKHSHQIELSGL